MYLKGSYIQYNDLLLSFKSWNLFINIKLQGSLIWALNFIWVSSGFLWLCLFSSLTIVSNELHHPYFIIFLCKKTLYTIRKRGRRVLSSHRGCAVFFVLTTLQKAQTSRFFSTLKVSRSRDLALGLAKSIPVLLQLLYMYLFIYLLDLFFHL